MTNTSVIKKVFYFSFIVFLSSPFVFSQTSSYLNNSWYQSDSTNNNTVSNVNIATTNNLNSQNSNVSNNTNFINLGENVSNKLTQLQSKYNLNNSQMSSLTQVARSYQNILNSPPTNNVQANELARKDALAISCASTRIPSNFLDDIVYQIELTSIDTPNKRNFFDYYTSLLSDSNNTVQVNASPCEDEYATNINQNTNSNINQNNVNTNTVSNLTGNNYILNGIVSDNQISTKCTVLTYFMSFGSKNSQVFELQNFLTDNGYMELMPTGFYGRNTEAAVREWQVRHNIDVRGYVGPNTRASIASLTCGGDSAKIDKAFKGQVYVAYTAPVKTVKAVTPATPKISNTNSGDTEVIISTTTETITYTTNTFAATNTNQGASLSNSGGSFYLKRSPVNSLYFSYRADTSRDPIFICIEKQAQNSCGSYQAFTQVTERYDPGNMDIINNSDRWLFNIYFDNNKWSTGGKIYMRNGINNISEVYTVLAKDSL